MPDSSPMTTADRKKIHGQVFTPVPVVKQMLDEIGYTANNLDIMDASIMEPSFGKGVFLYEIIDRLITLGEKAGYSPEALSHVIDTNVHGIELDARLYEETKQGLFDYLVSRGIEDCLLPGLKQGNSLAFVGSYSDMKYVVGNPPYVRIHNLSPEDRIMVKRFQFSTGTTDLYIPFFELGLSFLDTGGILAYITPNSFMKNTSQRSFRKYLVDGSLLRGLTDYRSTKIFGDADTYATITYLEKLGSETPEPVKYELVKDGEGFTTTIDYDSLRATAGDAWNFADPHNYMKSQTAHVSSFADLGHVQYGLATLRDRIYVDLNAMELDGSLTLFKGELVESEILRPVVKASKYRGEKVDARMLFPYTLSNGSYVPMTEEFLIRNYPKAYVYLTAHKEDLLKRDMDKNAVSWFQYGRSQGISTVDKPKVVFSHVIHPDKPVESFVVESGTLVYSGFFTMLHDGVDHSDFSKQIESSDFRAYVKIVGKDMSGGFVAITPKHVKAYRFTK